MIGAMTKPHGNNLSAFGIHVDDVERARKFCEAVFGWRFTPWGPPGFYLIQTGPDENPGVQGLMHARQTPRTGQGLNGLEPNFTVLDVDEIAKRVVKNGGTITMPKAVIPTVGELIRFLDTEGNDIGAMKYTVPVRT